MVKQIKGLLYFYRTDLTFSIFVFWCILLSMLVASVSIMYIFPSIEVMSFSFTAPIYVYCAIIGFLMARHTVAFGIKLGATRKNIYVSIAIFFIGLALVKSTVASLIQAAVSTFFIRDDMNFIFAHPMMLFEDTLLNRIYTDFFIIVFLTSLTYLISLLFYKYGLLVAGFILGMLFVLFMYSVIAGDLIKWIVESFQNSVYIFFAQLGMIALIAYVIAWIPLRRITVVAKK